jgi:hypothetical protein
MTVAIDLHPTDDFVTATGGARRDERPAAPGGAPVITIDPADLDGISGGIADGARRFPLPWPSPPPLPPRPSPPISLPPPLPGRPSPPPLPLGPVYPTSPDVA